MKTSWTYPERKALTYKSIRLEPIELEKHAEPLYEILTPEYNQGEDLFAYMLNTGPFPTLDIYNTYLQKWNSNPLQIPYAVYSNRFNQYVGAATMMNIHPEHGTAELGAIWYCKKAQRSEVNTQSIYCFLKYLIEELEYRRIEWKCNNANQRSKDAAIRLGFTFEGVFRNHYVDKGNNRDTAWYSIIIEEWPRIREYFESNLLKSGRG